MPKGFILSSERYMAEHPVIILLALICIGLAVVLVIAVNQIKILKSDSIKQTAECLEKLRVCNGGGNLKSFLRDDPAPDPPPDCNGKSNPDKK